VMAPVVNPSSDPANDDLNGQGVCGQGAPPLGVQDRCGYGPRIPILVISPYAKSNYVDNTLATQTSIVSFIEYNWGLGNLGPNSYDQMAGSIMNMFDFSRVLPNDGQVFMNPATGEVVSGAALGTPNGQVLSPGIPDLSTTGTCTDVDTNPDVCATQNDFAGNSIGAGNDVWFNAVADITPKESSTPLTVYYTGQSINLQLAGGNGIPISIPAPNSEVVFSSTASTVTTTYSGGMWVTTVPLGYQGDVFIGGVAYQVPSGVSLAGARADWTGVFSGTTNSFTLTWQWGAAVYDNLGSGIGTSAFYNNLDVKPAPGNTASAYYNSDNAGTPENYRANVLASATTGSYVGGDQYTGAYSGPGQAYYQTYLLNE
jgi:hypothetical protein